MAEAATDAQDPLSGTTGTLWWIFALQAQCTSIKSPGSSLSGLFLRGRSAWATIPNLCGGLFCLLSARNHYQVLVDFLSLWEKETEAGDIRITPVSGYCLQMNLESYSMPLPPHLSLISWSLEITRAGTES